MRLNSSSDACAPRAARRARQVAPPFSELLAPTKVTFKQASVESIQPLRGRCDAHVAPAAVGTDEAAPARHSSQLCLPCLRRAREVPAQRSLEDKCLSAGVRAAAT